MLGHVTGYFFFGGGGRGKRSVSLARTFPCDACKVADRVSYPGSRGAPVHEITRSVELGFGFGN